jgi:hypothetical protein
MSLTVKEDSTQMPFMKITAQAQSLKKIAEAIKEARAAGVRDPLGLFKKALESRKEHKTYKSNYNK